MIKEYLLTSLGSIRVNACQRKVWLKACTDAGLEGLIFHDLRRSAIREMVRNGYSERVAMEISGHKTRGVFDHYNIVSLDDQRDAANRRTSKIVSYR